jgi:hypothetical protein
LALALATSLQLAVTYPSRFQILPTPAKTQPPPFFKPLHNRFGIAIQEKRNGKENR